jgi:thiol-disulfide isomerase/thioredoxin
MSTRRWRWFGVVSVVLMTLTGCGGGGVERITTSLGAADVTISSRVLEPAEREVIPDLRGQTIDGATLDVESLRGSIVVVNYWGSWCAPCRAETPELVALATDSQGLGVRFVGVNIRDNLAAAQAFARTYNISYPSLYDPDTTTAFEFGPMAPRAVPSTYLLDRDGRVAAFAYGRVTRRALEAMINAVHETGNAPTEAS